MQRDEITEVEIAVEFGGVNLLHMLLFQDGQVNRRGNGNLPALTTAFMGHSDGSVFRELVDLADKENVLPRQGVYDSAGAQQMCLRYYVAFSGQDGNAAVFDFRVGRTGDNIPVLMPFFNYFVSNAVMLTEPLYQEHLFILARRARKAAWWRFW